MPNRTRFLPRIRPGSNLRIGEDGAGLCTTKPCFSTRTSASSICFFRSFSVRTISSISGVIRVPQPVMPGDGFRDDVNTLELQPLSELGPAPLLDVLLDLRPLFRRCSSHVGARSVLRTSV